MGAVILEFSSASRPRGSISASQPALSRNGRPLPEPLTETCRNQRARLGRRETWRAAAYLTAHRRAKIDWLNALGTAQRHGVADATAYPDAAYAGHPGPVDAVDLWRAALVVQMLTPSPDGAAIAWKRAALRAGQWRYADAKVERLERSIQADVEWLAAHPARHSRAKVAAPAAPAAVGEMAVKEA